MIDIKTLCDYSKFINLKQVCFLSDVTYGTIRDKVWRFKTKKKVISLTEEESLNLTKGLRKIGIKKFKINN